MKEVPSLLCERGIINSISSLHTDADSELIFYYRVGWRGVNSIVAYGEPGQMAEVPWLAVYKDNVMVARIPAHAAEIIYEVG